MRGERRAAASPPLQLSWSGTQAIYTDADGDTILEAGVESAGITVLCGWATNSLPSLPLLQERRQETTHGNAFTARVNYYLG